MPLYDNIADAFELLPGGALVSLTNVGATDETNENANAAGNESVWVKLDLSNYIGDVEITLAVANVTGDAGFHPYMDTLRVNDPTFDPNSPDFSKLSFVNFTIGATVGDGTASPPPATFMLQGGSSFSGLNDSANGIFYIYFTDWDYDGTEGSADLTYDVPPEPICINAVDVINPNCTTASVVSGRVQEDWRDWWDFGSNGYNLPEQTLKWNWAGAAGLYQLNVSGQLAANGSGTVSIIVSVNGRPFLGTRSASFTNTTPDSWYPYFGFNMDIPHVYDTDDFDQNPWLVLAPGDLVEVQIMSNANLTGFSGFDAFQVGQLCFLPDPDAPESTTCTGAVRFAEAAIGDDWGDEDGWGGQRLIPDEIYADLGYTVDSHTGSQFPWGVNQTDFDFVALEDGTIYVILHDSHRFTGDPVRPTVASDHRHFVVVKKWDGAAWTQIATLNVNDPSDQFPTFSMTCETDGSFVYFAWWELTTYTPGTSGATRTWQSDWHLKRLDVTDDSIVELGTGQHSINVGTGLGQTPDNAELGTLPATLAPMICVLAEDSILVSVVEDDEIVISGNSFGRRRGFVWHWDGASWTDIGLPDPGTLGPNPDDWEITGENGFWDQLIQMVAADTSGLITDGATVVYAYIYNDGTNFLTLTLTIPWTVGGGWGTEILTDWMAVGLERDRQPYVISDPTGFARLLDHQVMWSPAANKLVLTGDLIFGGSTDAGIWDAWQMNDDGDQWELMEPIAPGNNAGAWRQTRNTAAIGPDGDIWRCTMSESVVGMLNFEPHVLKRSGGYSYGYANGARYPIGRKDDGVADPQGNIWTGGLIEFFSTTNFRIRWVGTKCYVMGNLYNEPQFVNGQLFADYAGEWPYGEGFWVIEGDYVPCTRFRPQIYRRVLG